MEKTSSPSLSSREREITACLSGNRSYDAGVKLFFKYSTDARLRSLFLEEYSEYKWQRLQEVLSAMISKAPAPVKPGLVAARQLVATALVKEQAATAAASNTSFANTEELKAIAEDLEELKDDTASIDYRMDELEEQLHEQKRSGERISDDIAKLKQAQKSAPKGWPAPLDEVTQSLYDQWLPLFVEKKNLQARIYDVALAGQKDPAKKEEARQMSLRILRLRDDCRAIYTKRDAYLQHGQLPVEEQLIEIPGDAMRWPLTLENFKRYLRDYKNKVKKYSPEDARYANCLKQIRIYEWGVAELKKRLNIT